MRIEKSYPLDPTTGLPVLPAGQFWRVAETLNGYYSQYTVMRMTTETVTETEVIRGNFLMNMWAAFFGDRTREVSHVKEVVMSSWGTYGSKPEEYATAKAARNALDALPPEEGWYPESNTRRVEDSIETYWLLKTNKAFPETIIWACNRILEEEERVEAERIIHEKQLAHLGDYPPKKLAE